MCLGKVCFGREIRNLQTVGGNTPQGEIQTRLRRGERPSDSYVQVVGILETCIKINNAQKNTQEWIFPGGVPNGGVAAQVFRTRIFVRCFRFFEKAVSDAA